ncbi:GntR family transcriptional regulator [Sutterella sp.]|uniref:GntR family transcriptional regulator n=1 Tax=Sutterella sp. TaxID=1981025 RepID=UPI0026E0459B|nr:GntR family transcriptional regulator [Sutterella sp.]MDO5532506.1 GntR family transcriptional regulator [Sutterella sp.]
MPDRSSHEALRFRRIASVIIRNIESGLYTDGRLPGRRQLESLFGCSRSTEDAALDLLEREHWILREPKKRPLIVPRKQDFEAKLAGFVARSGFRPPLMNEVYRRADVRKTRDQRGIGDDVVSLARLGDEHWDGHINLDLEIEAFNAALKDFRAGKTEMFATGGMPGLKAALCAHLPTVGIPADPSQILITSRRLQTYRLVSEVLLGPSTEFWYPEMSLVRFYGIADRHTSWRREMPIDADGRIDFSGFGLSKRPKVLALEPDCAKPFGGTVSDADRAWLVDEARRTGAFILEDSYSRGIDERIVKPPLASLDPTHECVIYLGAVPSWLTTMGTFNFVVAHERLINQLRASGRRDYMFPGLFSQIVAEKLFSEHLIDPMRERFLAFHRERVVQMEAILRKYLGDRFTWRLPCGFGSVCIDLAGVNLRRLWRCRRGIDFEPAWFYGEKEPRHVLLRYTVTLAKFEEGVKRLRENIELYG